MLVEGIELLGNAAGGNGSPNRNGWDALLQVLIARTL